MTSPTVSLGGIVPLSVQLAQGFERLLRASGNILAPDYTITLCRSANPYIWSIEFVPVMENTEEWFQTNGGDEKAKGSPSLLINGYLEIDAAAVFDDVFRMNTRYARPVRPEVPNGVRSASISRKVLEDAIAKALEGAH